MRYIIIFISVFASSLVVLPDSVAGIFELSGGFGFNRTNYPDESFIWNRRYSAGVAYHFTERSGIEVSYQNIVTRTLIEGVQDTTYNDKVYALNWVQSFLGRSSTFQPYVKLGIGQLNRDAEGTFAGGGSPPATLDSLTVVVAAGTKLHITQRLAVRAEAVSYLTGGSISTWKDNVSLSVGVSLFL